MPLPLPTKLVDPVTLSDLLCPISVCGLAESLAWIPDKLDLLPFSEKGFSRENLEKIAKCNGRGEFIFVAQRTF
jgi:hypothetical protein